MNAWRMIAVSMALVSAFAIADNNRTARAVALMARASCLGQKAHPRKSAR